MTTSDQTDRKPDPADIGIPNVYGDPQQPIPGEDATGTGDAEDPGQTGLGEDGQGDVPGADR